MSLENQFGLIYFMIGSSYGMYRWHKEIRYVMIWRYYCLTVCIIFWPIVTIYRIYEYVKMSANVRNKI